LAVTWVGYALVDVTLDVGVLGDVNLDGAVSFLDIAPFISVLNAWARSRE